MKYREKKLGPMANFLLPSLKLRQRELQREVEDTLLEKYGGFTVTAGSISGYWLDENGDPVYGEHQEYKVAVRDRAEELKAYLAELAGKLGEDCIYLEVGDEAMFIS
jgi:hypothetical protein